MAKHRDMVFTYRVTHEDVLYALQEVGAPVTRRTLQAARKAISLRYSGLTDDDTWPRIYDQLAHMLGVEYQPEPPSEEEGDDDDAE